MKKVSEKLLERKLRLGCIAAGWLSLKFTSPNYSGVPDRICLGWYGKVKFAEIKTTGKPATKRQLFVHRILERLGFEVWLIDSEETLQEFLKSLKTKKHLQPHWYEQKAA